MAEIQILDEDWSWALSLDQYIQEGNFPHNWIDFFKKEEIQEILKKVSQELSSESKDCTIYPRINHVFRAFQLDLSKIRVVFLGMDPYHNGSAIGICFSVLPGNQINPSLMNIYKELENEGYKPKKDGCLMPWVKQGCFMLNTALTVEKGNPDSHTHIWYDFTEKLLDYVANNTKNVAWVLLGAKAEVFKKYTNRNGHKAFISSHPSPLSAFKGFRSYPGFLGSGIFKQVNNFLGERKISW